MHNLKKISDYKYIIPKYYKHNMKTEGLIYADDKLIKQITKDNTIKQIANVATLPGIVGKSLAMPDAHQGYGFCIGGVGAFDIKTGVVSAGGVGFDINCGVRLLRSNIGLDDVKDKIEELINQMFRDIPSGTGRGGKIRLNEKQMTEVLNTGARWACKTGYGFNDDLNFIEENGAIKFADSKCVSNRAKQRGGDQLGTLGSGNHFIELQYVDEVYNENVANGFQLKKGQIVVLLHTGSRGLGHQVCSESIENMKRAMRKHNINVSDRELACAPIGSEEGNNYLGAMGSAANFAFANRQCITHWVRNAINKVMGGNIKLDVVYDVCHNIAKFETHKYEGKNVEVLVHRKGATRAFPKDHKDIPDAYKSFGQPVLIPGSMGTASYVMVGKELAMNETFGSICHGAGRTLSRMQAKRNFKIEETLKHLSKMGIYAKSASRNGIIEEHPEAYKDILNVVDVVHSSGLAEKVVRLIPLGVIKG